MPPIAEVQYVNTTPSFCLIIVHHLHCEHLYNEQERLNDRITK
jgi:hypothetical protein